MSGAEMATFIKGYIGPQFKNNDISTEIWVGTLHSTAPDFTSFYPEYITTTLGDSEVEPFISGVGMQWNAMVDAHMVPENYPTVKTMQTETQCGNFYWNADYNDEAAPNDWGYGVFTFHRMLQWLRSGVNSYCQWNIVLDEKGFSNSVTNPWPQNSMISVNQSTGEVRYNPQFYAVKHFSHFVKKGAVRIATTGNYSAGGSNLLNENIGESVTDGDMMGFLNPNGDRVLVLRNSSDADMSVAVKLGTSKFKPMIPANSMNTFLINGSVAVRNDKVHAVQKQNISVRRIPGRVLFTISIPPALAHRPVPLSIMDAFGRTVKVLQGSVRNNRIKCEWNGTNYHGAKVVPGVYFARIMLEKDVIHQKFTYY
jgi:glucosylceramidase